MLNWIAPEPLLYAMGEMPASGLIIPLNAMQIKGVFQPAYQKGPVVSTPSMVI